MHTSTDYSLQELPGPHPLGEYRRRLVVRGRPTRLVVNGDAIGLQLRTGAFTLLATSYDYFEGCQHWIYLLKADRVIDRLCLPDEIGFIENVVVVADNEVAFGCFGTNDRWHLVVDTKGFWSFSLAALRWRPLRCVLAKRHISVRRMKGAPWTWPSQTPPTAPL